MEYASTFSRMFEAQIFVLHTLDTIPVLAPDTMDLTTESVIYETERNAKNDLHAFVTSRLSQVPNVIEVVRRGVAEDQIVRFATDESIDLIVMATHGRSGIAHVLMGSVAEKVVQRSAVPVLTVKPEKVKFSSFSPADSRTLSELTKR